MAKTKALISFAVTAKLICVFVLAYAKSRFSYDAAHIFSFGPFVSQITFSLSFEINQTTVMGNQLYFAP